MMFSFDLLLEAVVFGVLLGCFYAAVSLGLSVAFGLLDVPHVAHPALMVFGAYCTWMLVQQGLDPIVSGLALMPLFFLLGMALYRFYYEVFERRGSDTGVRGIAFFFGVALIVEVGLTSAPSRPPTSARAWASATCASRSVSWSRRAWRSR
jgi:branched-chain amino acid transport system permease protein